MSATRYCHHPELSYVVSTALEGGKAYAEITAAHCPFCGTRWRWTGVDSRFDPDMPTANRAGTKLLLPMVEITT